MSSGVSPTSAIFRRRDKRKHLSTSAIDLRQPLEWISLAIRYDERDEELLKAPLEQGRIYDSRHFLQIIQFLEDKSSVPSRSSRTNNIWTQWNPWRKKRRAKDEDGTATTPIVLSGLLATLGDRAPPDLVSSTQTLRTAALRRVRIRRQQQWISQVGLPIASLAVLLFLYMRGLMNFYADLRDLALLPSGCLGVESCRYAQAGLWERFQDYGLMLEGGECTRNCFHPLLDGRFLEAPFAMHTVLAKELVTLEELWDQRPVQSSRDRVFAGNLIRRTSDLSWLGTTNINRQLVEIVDQLEKGTEISILDAGCGVGGTLYSLLTSKRIRSGEPFTYYGITVSPAELQFAKLLAKYHGLAEKPGIGFALHNFEDGLPPVKFSVVVAVESLSYATDFIGTTGILLSAVKPGGVLIVVDDVMIPPFTSLDLTKRLLVKEVWNNAFSSAGCAKVVTLDEGIDSEIVMRTLEHAHNRYWPFGELRDFWHDRKAWMANMKRRKEAFERAELSTFLFICIKARKGAEQP